VVYCKRNGKPIGHNWEKIKQEEFDQFRISPNYLSMLHSKHFTTSGHMDPIKYILDEEEIADLVIEDASDEWICGGNDLVEKCFVDHDTTADVINFKECFYGDYQDLEMINNVAVGEISVEEIIFFENDLILYESLLFEDTIDSGLRFNIGNLWNPLIWYHHFNESSCESMEGVQFESTCFGEDENHPSLPVVLYSSNFSPPVYIDVPLNGTNDTSGDMLELSYPINPCHQSLVSLDSGEFSSMCYDELLIYFHFGINPSIGLTQLDTFIREVICFYLWFKENYKEIFINVSVYGISYISGADLGIYLVIFLLSYFWITCSCMVSPSFYDSYPVLKCLVGRILTLMKVLPSMFNKKCLSTQ
jgi:hypothetical protein